VYSVPLAQDSALLDTGLDLALGPRTTAGVSYLGQFGDRVTENSVKRPLHLAVLIGYAPCSFVFAG